MIKPMQKRGQVTVFIVLGIVMLIIVAIFLYINSLSVEDLGQEIDYKDTASVQLFIEGCLRQVSEEALFYIGERGGYYTFDDTILYADYSPTETYLAQKVPFYYYNGEILIPEISEIEENIDSYIVDHLDECLSNLSSFTKQGWEISSEDYVIDSKITTNNVKMSLDFPLTVGIGENFQELSSFEVEQDLNFLDMYIFAEQIIKLQEENPDYVLYGEINLMAKAYDFDFFIDNLEEDVVWYGLLFNNAMDSGYNYELGFAVKYDWEDIFEE